VKIRNPKIEIRKWTESVHCAMRVHCVSCRGDAAFRRSIVDRGLAQERDFACPFGVTLETAAEARYERARWPGWARGMARFAAPPDTGLGDTIARHFGVTGEAFKGWFKAMFGRSCGCAERQETLNFKYPYQWTK
jgi:hypothetical protein